MVTYKEAGVDIAAADAFVDKLRAICPDIGGFGGFYPLGDQILVAGTDGVGTKLKLAFELNRHDTVGIDLVAMSVNDILTSGAKPLFFLDYFATGRLQVDTAEKVVSGIVEGCCLSNCALLGGETAEMPGFYQDGEYDLAGFAVGIVPKTELIDGSTISANDVIVGITSSGFHSNGYSLIRKVIGSIKSCPYAAELLTPTKIYVKPVLEFLKEYTIKGMAHITGSGMPGNIPRVFPKGLGGIVKKGSWNIPKIFTTIQQQGNIPEEEMYNTFNMGIGFTLIMDEDEAKSLCSSQSDCHIIGKIEAGEGIQIV